ncbi:hypothetical protein Rsw2DRAFT_3267 [Rhodobacter ferrooxidans]|uniref:Uncharacterized protein n=1 Tax=Rhodobacter ferrooxidans TaxID=371731 RepID=C8S5D8_9RHOB|nr:hypothetical protein Rsw2DRAFT_3267 [Rhodobacter sp. SW2]
MPVWFWVLAVIAAVAAVLAMLPAVVILSSFYAFGWGFPVGMLWFVAANLWWVLLLLWPVIWSLRRGRILVGLVFSAGLMALAVGGFYSLRAAHLASLYVPLVVAQPLSGQVLSAELVEGRDGALLGNSVCGDLCERLLIGGMDWVRVVSPGPDGVPVATVTARAEAVDCRALDPDFPDGAPCLLLRADRGSAADLRLTVTQQGDGHASREDMSGLAFLLSRQRLLVEDLRGPSPVLLHDQSRRIWMQATQPVPLHANAGFDGNGLHGGGLTFPWVRLQDAPLDVASVLQAAAVPLAPARGFTQTKPGDRSRAAEGYFDERPHDLALIASLLGKPGERQAAQISAWLDRFSRGRAPTLAERALLARLPLETQRIHALDRLMQVQPELFVPDFRAYYDRVLSGPDQQSTTAAAVILETVRRDPPESHAAEADLFRTVIASGRQWGYLIQVAGRYGFDPLPLFQAEVKAPNRPKDGPDLYALFHAACNSDPKWADSLAPFVHAQMLPLLAEMDRRKDALRMGTTALMMLGREDLAQDLHNRVDWPTVYAVESKGFNHITMEQLQERLLGSQSRTAAEAAPSRRAWRQGLIPWAGVAITGATLACECCPDEPPVSCAAVAVLPEGAPDAGGKAHRGGAGRGTLLGAQPGFPAPQPGGQGAGAADGQQGDVGIAGDLRISGRNRADATFDAARCRGPL